MAFCKLVLLNLRQPQIPVLKHIYQKNPIWSLHFECSILHPENLTLFTHWHQRAPIFRSFLRVHGWRSKSLAHSGILDTTQLQIMVRLAPANYLSPPSVNHLYIKWPSFRDQRAAALHDVPLRRAALTSFLKRPVAIPPTVVTWMLLNTKKTEQLLFKATCVFVY